MFKRLLKKYTLFTLLTFFHVVGLNAQTQTHAEATSQKWKGIDVNTVIGNNAYPDNNTMTSGYPFLLFNVGTGRFVVQGGDWAMEGRLFYTDFGWCLNHKELLLLSPTLAVWKKLEQL